MKKLAYMATFVGALGLVACGGGGGGGDDISINPDGGGGGSDGGGNPAACNPVTQQGCESDEKCSWLVENPDMGLGRTACVPNGDAQPGEACMFDEAVGYDNCAATDNVGYICSGGTCAEACSQMAGCTSEGYCVLVNGLFDDLDNVGLCAPQCDTHLQNCEAEADSCYSFPVGAGETPPVDGICFGVPPGAEMLTQGETCQKGATGACFLNGCAAEHGPELALGEMIDTCAYFCEPIETYHDSMNDMDVGDAETAKGNDTAENDRDASCDTDTPGGSGTQCRYLASSYNWGDIDTTLIPKTMGFCAPTASDWGDCTTYDPYGIAAAIEAADPQNAEEAAAARDAFCEENAAACAFGCVTPETLDMIFNPDGASDFVVEAMMTPPHVQQKSVEKLREDLRSRLEGSSSIQ